MQSTKRKIHLEIQTSRKSPVGILRTTYWDKELAKTMHTQHGRITGCSLGQLKLLQRAFRQEVTVQEAPSFKILASRELGASQVILQLARELNLHHVLYSRSAPWVDCIMAMIIGRIVYQGSKLSLCNQWQNTVLWELCGIQGRPDADAHCYEPLDHLLARQKAVQKTLASRHLQDGVMVLYDITSTYFEGEYRQSDLVEFGYNRDQKRGHAQVVVGLITNAQGCPVACEVFKGSTNDSSTVMGKMDEIRRQYGLKSFIFVGDRGMVTQGHFETIHKLENIHSVSALTHAQLKTLQERQVIHPELFDDKSTVEILDPDDLSLRYCLCKNPSTMKAVAATRRRLLQLTVDELRVIAGYAQCTHVEKLGARVGKVLSKYKMGKFITWSIQADPKNARSRSHQLKWELLQDKIDDEAQLDGCYVIRTDTPKSKMDTHAVVGVYKSLGHVERSFRNLKTVLLEMRPVYHKTDDRIRAHIFLCMLAYYLQWHMAQRLRPLFEQDASGKNRQWTFEGVIDCLRQQCRHTVRMLDMEYQQDGEPTDDQKKVMELLSTKDIATSLKS